MGMLVTAVMMAVTIGWLTEEDIISLIEPIFGAQHSIVVTIGMMPIASVMTAAMMFRLHLFLTHRLRSHDGLLGLGRSGLRYRLLCGIVLFDIRRIGLDNNGAGLRGIGLNFDFNATCRHLDFDPGWWNVDFDAACRDFNFDRGSCRFIGLGGEAIAGGKLQRGNTHKGNN